MEEKFSVADILEALRRVKDPSSGKDIVQLDWVGEMKSYLGNVSFTVYYPRELSDSLKEFRSAIVGAVKQVPGVKAVLPNFTSKKPPSPDNPFSRIRHTLVVGSAKGGVGKSSTTVNMAMALAKDGYAVGLLDADIYGPSIPGMLSQLYSGKVGDLDAVKVEGEKLLPFEMAGVKVMSVAMLIAAGEPTVWRAPMATKMLQQFLKGVEWGELDFLLVDLPPGTGDIPLSLAQEPGISGLILVTSPQKVALRVVEKGLHMFQQLKVPVVGIVETMSGFICGACGEKTSIFGKGAAEYLSKSFNLPILGKIPLDEDLVRSGDEGKPIFYYNPLAPSAKAFDGLAKNIVSHIRSEDKEEEVVPLAIEGIPREDGNHSLAIYWSDGIKYVYSCKQLRLACPCASCVDEFTRERKIKAEDIPKDIYIEKASPVGRYGVNILWTDAHSTGIYTYSYLREIPCEKYEESPKASTPFSKNNNS